MVGLKEFHWLRSKPNAKTWIVIRKPHNQDRLEEFLRFNIIAIGWPEVDFSGMSLSTMEDKIRHYRGHVKTKGTVTRGVNAAWRFVNQMKRGHLVIVPKGSEVHLGVITGRYRHDRSKASDRDGYSNQRSVRWFSKDPYPGSVFGPQISLYLKSRLPSVSEFPTLKKGAGKTEAKAVRSRMLIERLVGLKNERESHAELSAKRIVIRKRHAKLINDFNRFIRYDKKATEGDYDVLLEDWPPGKRLLVEAKSAVNGGTGRHQMREAIGQLFDYRHMLSSNGMKNIQLALLTPEKPTPEVQSLVYGELRIEIIWRDRSRFAGTTGIQQEFKRRGLV